MGSKETHEVHFSVVLLDQVSVYLVQILLLQPKLLHLYFICNLFEQVHFRVQERLQGSFEKVGFGLPFLWRHNLVIIDISHRYIYSFDGLLNFLTLVL